MTHQADDSLTAVVRATLKGRRMIRKGDRVVAAVSGGADSVCLLDVLSRLAPELGLDLAVAHFDHGLRGDQDESETLFVRGLAEGLGLCFFAERADPPLQGRAGSLEERARDARYAFLERARQAHKARCVAVGHTLDDQAETVLMRLLRGAGPSGLSGIPPVRGPAIIRPLIRVRRRQIEAYLDARGLSWRLDPSNLKTNHLRNRIRLKLLPVLLDFQPQLVEHLGELADLIRDEDAYMDQVSLRWVEANAEQDSTLGTAVPMHLFLRQPPALQRRIVRLALRREAGGLRRINREHVRKVMALARGDRPQAGVDLPGGLRVSRSYDRLVFGTRGTGERPDYNVSIPGPGSYSVEEAGVRVILEERPRNTVSSLSCNGWTAFLDAQAIRYPLEMRPWRAGDRFVPLGMQGRRKVKDFLIDLKVPTGERERIPVIVSAGRVAWLCGYRIDDRFKVTEATGRVLVVKILFSRQEAQKE